MAVHLGRLLPPPGHYIFPSLCSFLSDLCLFQGQAPSSPLRLEQRDDPFPFRSTENAALHSIQPTAKRVLFREDVAEYIWASPRQASSANHSAASFPASLEPCAIFLEFVEVLKVNLQNMLLDM